VSLPAVYPILDVALADACGWAALDLARVWLDEGVRFFQVRAKRLPGGAALELIDSLVALSSSRGARVIVNDRADLARMAGAAGVHVGQTDLSAADARRIVGPDAIVGLSTHTDEQVASALAAPADYIAIGPVFATSSKEEPDAVVGLDGVSRAWRQTQPSGRPLVAIGGITLDTARSVLAAGASSVAVISDLLKHDPGTRIREYLTHLEPSNLSPFEP
jgi:thiamine-phosphate pyrophosphorylase